MSVLGGRAAVGRCWYSSPKANASFASFCDPANCTCAGRAHNDSQPPPTPIWSILCQRGKADPAESAVLLFCAAYDKLALGLEAHAMCWSGGGSPPPPPPGQDDYRGWMSQLACLMDGNWCRRPAVIRALRNDTCVRDTVCVTVRQSVPCLRVCGAPPVPSSSPSSAAALRLA